MKFKRINDNRLQIIVTSKDLLARNIRKWDLVPHNSIAQELFKEILEKATNDCNFQVMQDTPILVEIYPIEGDSLLLMLTKVDNVGSMLSDLTNHEVNTLLNEEIKENFNDEIGVYFEKLDDLYDYVENTSKMIALSRLYYDNSTKQYALILTQDDTNYFLNLTEYGKQEYISSSYLFEYCTLLLDGDIINILK